MFIIWRARNDLLFRQEKPRPQFSFGQLHRELLQVNNICVNQTKTKEGAQASRVMAHQFDPKESIPNFLQNKEAQRSSKEVCGVDCELLALWNDSAQFIRNFRMPSSYQKTIFFFS